MIEVIFVCKLLIVFRGVEDVAPYKSCFDAYFASAFRDFKKTKNALYFCHLVGDDVLNVPLQTDYQK